MSLAIVYSRAQVGMCAPLVSVEVHISNGLPSFAMVGLPEATVKESKERVRGALLNSHFEFPARRITVNLAPADLPKEGGRFDLPIAIGILAASKQISAHALERYEMVGELALSGALRGIRGVLPMAVQTRDAKRTLICAQNNAQEACLVHDGVVLAGDHLLQICAHLQGEKRLVNQATTLPVAEPQCYEVDFHEVHGQHNAKRALEIAAAGGHSVLMLGPPGTGKTMLASRLPTILPPLTDAEALEVAAVTSVSRNGLDPSRWRIRSFRNPHHTSSAVALVGGGSTPRPGEISLAHLGVLFLDELPEFDRKVLEVLREPMESGCIHISRAARQATFPARFQLIAAMNPCPCGYFGDASGRCHCTREAVFRYRQRISGPILDRIDIHVDVPKIDHKHMINHSQYPPSESSAQIQSRVNRARQQQIQRAGTYNAVLRSQQIERDCTLSSQSQQLLIGAMEKLDLSARAYHRILKLARTIADLANAESIQTMHVSEAIGYRILDRQSLAP